jgi:methylthioribose-1-phosphate isomerase
MIVDTMVGSLFQHHNIHAVGASFATLSHLCSFMTSSPAVGADRIAKNGDTANKVHWHLFYVTGK